jgi:hypothetical protein
MIVLPVLAKKRTSQRSSVLSAHRGKAAIEPTRPPTTKADIAAHEDIMTRSLPYLLLALIAATGFSWTAGAANCDGDRKLYPKEWSAVAAETPLFTCNSRYLRLRVFLTRRDESTLMLTVANDKSVYRAIVDGRDAERIRKQTGLYILYSQKTCFIRGNYSSPAVLSFADNSMSNSVNFRFAADSLNAFDACESSK